MFNIAETIQSNLGYSSLSKIDPNTQDVEEKEKSFGTGSLAQAAIPAVLTGLFNYILQPETDNLLLLQDNGKWLPIIFGNKETTITERIASYAGTSATSAKGEMEHIADEAVRLIKSNMSEKYNMDQLKAFSAEHKNDGLPYLPAALQTGQLLGNNNLDDRTHKMEGPISSLMHSFEKQFGSDEK